MLARWITCLALMSLSLPAFAQICDQRSNPHSFACSDAAFRGDIFPMIDISESRLQGNWAFVTYADVRGQEGPEFRMLVNPNNPRIPGGIQNQFDGSRAGSMNWVRDRSVFANFGASGHHLFEEIGRTQITDRFTAQIVFKNGAETHALQCRIFDRHRIEHLQCRWQTLSVRQKRFILRGYLGFLRGR